MITEISTTTGIMINTLTGDDKQLDNIPAKAGIVF
jgi:hypothetical protein